MHQLQHISELGDSVDRAGARHVIIAPGSRNAPLTQLFTSNKRFICHSIVDERSAAYVALGMARQMREPVVVVTTSGTAVLNLAPALAEAYQQQIPLLVLTADRPREMLSQFNNQVCDQRAPFFNYSKGFLELPAELREESDLAQGILSVEKLFQEAISYPKGPVHLNLPLTDPLYEPLPGSVLSGGDASTDPAFLPAASKPDLDMSSKKVMILAGMGTYDPELLQALEAMHSVSQTMVVAENISNLNSELFISTPELVLAGASEKERMALAPDLLIAFGQQVVSKRLKNFIQSQEDLEIVEVHNDGLLAEWIKKLSALPELDNPYQRLWKEIEERESCRAKSYLQTAPFGNLSAVARIMDSVPPQRVIHLGNSTTIRFSQLLPSRPDLHYYSNRGTSGIDGSFSSAVGAAMVSELQHLLILGDLSFVYDSNALWNKNFPKNLKIVVLNDGGGGIFRLLDGPDKMDFFEEFSVTHHPVSLELLSSAFGRRLARATSMEELDSHLGLLFASDGGPSVLEVDTTTCENSRIFKALFTKAIS